mmetsp:Transcript_54328/g.119138  ORF Transcript_54328/g.119138 Transcript_54328/m.119138 type:complete len:204 (+) Transcript_54328:38-649(+)
MGDRQTPSTHQTPCDTLRARAELHRKQATTPRSRLRQARRFKKQNIPTFKASLHRTPPGNSPATSSRLPAPCYCELKFARKHDGCKANSTLIGNRNGADDVDCSPHGPPEQHVQATGSPLIECVDEPLVLGLLQVALHHSAHSIRRARHNPSNKSSKTRSSQPRSRHVHFILTMQVILHNWSYAQQAPHIDGISDGNGRHAAE